MSICHCIISLLTTLVRCRWHPHCKRPNCILSLLTAPCLLPLVSFTSWNQTIKPRPCCGGLKDQQSYSPRQRLGWCMACGNSALEGHKHSPPTIKLLPFWRILLCCPKFPGRCPGLMDHYPFRVHVAVKLGDCDTMKKSLSLLHYIGVG